MPSTRYVSMQQRRDRLRRLLIPGRQNLSGIYKINTKEKAFGFSLLMHAEIESYIEDRVSDVALRSITAWMSHGTISNPLLAMICYRDGGEVGFSENVFQITANRQLATVVHQSKIQLESRLRANHGVRHKNLAKLFMSIGLTPNAADEIVFNALDGFGAKRGEYAHKTPTNELLRQTDPITEANEIHNLIENLLTLDSLFDQYCLTCGI